MNTSTRYASLSTLIRPGLCLLAALLLSPPIHAASTWTGSVGSTDWATGGDWGGTAPITGSSLIFTSANASSSNTLTNTLTNSTFNIAGITFNSGALAYTMTGNTFNLTAGITNNGSNTEIFNNTGGLTASGSGATYTVNSSGGNTTLDSLTEDANSNTTTAVNGAGGTLSLGGFNIESASGTSNVTANFSGTGNVSITGTVANGGTGSDAIDYFGTGTLTLGGANTYTGATTLNSGSGLGTPYGGAINATLDLANAAALGGNGTLVLTYGTFDNTSSGGNAFTTLSSTNAITISSAAFLTFGGTNNLSFGSGTLTVNSGAVLNLNGNGSTLTFGAATNAGAAGLTDTINGAGNTLVLGSYTLSTNMTATTINLNGNGNVTITGAVAGGVGGTVASTLNYGGLGTLTLEGANTYSGGSTISRGTFDLTGTTATGNIVMTGGVFIEAGTGTFGDGTTATLSLSGGTFNAPGAVAILSGNGANSNQGATSIGYNTSVTLDFSAAGAPTTNILYSTAGGVNMAGGSLVIMGSPGQTNSQTLSQVQLQNNDNAAENTIVFDQNGAASLDATFTLLKDGNPGGTLDITFPTAGSVFQGSADFGNVTGNGSGLLARGAGGVAYATANGGTTWVTANSSTGQLGALATYSTGAANYLPANNVDVGTDTVGTAAVGSLRFNSTGLSLTQTGNLTIDSGGILVTPGSSGTISGGSLYSINDAELDVIDYGTLTISSTLLLNKVNNLTIAGTGTTTLSGTNTYTGTTYIGNNATLAVTNTSGLSTGPVYLGFGGTLQLRNDSTASFGNNFTEAQISTIDVNDVGNDGTTNKTLSLGTFTFSTQQQLNITGGNGYTLGLGAVTTTSTTSATMDLNPTTANVTVGTLTAIVSGVGTVKLDGTSSGNTITGVISNGGTGTFALTKENTSTWTLSNAETYTGATTVGGGVLNIGNGSSGNLINTGGTYSALTFNGTGTINFNEAAGSAQNMGALDFNIGDGTVESTYGGSGSSSVTFASAARTAGATGTFVVNGGTNGSSNDIVITSLASTPGFISQGDFVNSGGSGSTNYAWYDAGGFVRAINYTGDAGTYTTTGGTTLAATGVGGGSTAYAQTTGAITGQVTQTITTLDLAGTSTTAGQNDFTLASGQTLTIKGILRSGNTTGSEATISGGSGLAIYGPTDLVVNTAEANDALTINTVISGASGNDNLVKSGAGTLTLGALAVDTYEGNTYLNQGTLDISQDSNLGGYTGALPILYFNAGVLQAADATAVPGGVVLNANRNIVLGGQDNINDSASSGLQTIDTQDNTMTINGVISGGILPVTGLSTSVLDKIGSGTLILTGTNTYISQTTISAGTLQLGNGGTSGAIDATSAINDNATLAFDRSNTVTQGYDFLPVISGTGAVTQIGSGTVVLNVANTYTGGTTVSAGTMLVNNTSGSGTGTGNVAVSSGAILGGSGIIAPTGGNKITVANGGNITPGIAPSASQPTVANGILAINNTSSTAGILTFTAPSGATLTIPQLTFALGTGIAPVDGSGVTYAGSSSYIQLTLDVASEVQFNSNIVSLNFLTSASTGDYLLFQGTANSDYTGLTTGGILNSGVNGQITAGLTLANAYPSDELILQNGDIYLDVGAVPEPGTWVMLLGGLGLLVLWQRRKTNLS